MPWNTNDVDRFKKGLSDSQKKKWVEIANSTLASCLKSSGKNCDASAIRIANSAFSEQDGGESGIMRFRQTDPGGYIRFRMMQIKPGIKAVIGFKKDGGSETQSYLFDKKEFTPSQAKDWLKKHDAKSGDMEREAMPNRVFSDVHSAEIEIKEQDGLDPKRQELIVTLLKEGPGNSLNNNWYTRKCLESVRSKSVERPKQYFNHVENINDPARDIRDWASSIVESWIEESNGADRARLRARVKVYDRWLWERAQIAPGELAVSIEGFGDGEPKVIEGKPYNEIYEIRILNGINWVDYPGNADMGVQLLESEAKSNQEAKMTVAEMIEMMKSMTPEERIQIAGSPELKDVFHPVSEGSDVIGDDIRALTQKVKELQMANESGIKVLGEKVQSLENEKTSLSNKLEAQEIKEQETMREQLMEKLLKESKLEDKHKTETFRRILFSVKAYKEGEKTVTEEEQMKSLIQDREKICVAEVAAPDGHGAPAGGSIPSEREQQRTFTRNVFGIKLLEDKDLYPDQNAA